MNLISHFRLLASYNQWMNAKLYEAASNLPHSALIEDRGAFFGSLLGTLNHIVVGDTIWLKRFATLPASAEALREVAELPKPTSLDQILFGDFKRLHEHRAWLDEQIIHWVSALSDKDLDTVLSYRSVEGVAAGKRLSALILHFFNHQTHHRGQASTMLSQAGEDIGVTDLLALIADEQL